MRTVTEVTVATDCLKLTEPREPEAAARELIELLLREERFIWPDHEPLPKAVIHECFSGFLEKREGSSQKLPTDPMGDAIRTHVADFLGLDSKRAPEAGYRLSLEASEQLRFDALCHSISILAQIPPESAAIIPKVERIVEDRQTQVFGLMFQTDNRFVFRLRYHNPRQLKESTERLVATLAPRKAQDLNRLIEKSRTQALAGIGGRAGMDFEPILMKTPAGEVAQVGHVHTVGSRRGLLLHVAFRNQQRVLFFVAIGLMLLDLALQISGASAHIGHLDFPVWLAGTLGRATTAAFTTFAFAVLIEYIRLKGQFLGQSGAFVDWRPENR